MPLECIRNFHFYRISNGNVAGMRTLEVGASLAPRACGSGVACGNIHSLEKFAALSEVITSWRPCEAVI